MHDTCDTPPPPPPPPPRHSIPEYAPLLPVRCFSCRKVLADKGARYYRYMREEGLSAGDALTKCGLTRICCRTRVLTAVDVYSFAEHYTKDYSVAQKG